MKRLLVLFVLIPFVSFSQIGRLADYNLTHFTVREKKKTTDARETNPDAGLIPFDALAFDDYSEDLSKRDANTRFFTKPGTNKFVIQKAYSAINYKDEKGHWREINHRLTKVADGVFAANNQPSPVSIDLQAKVFTMTKNSTRFKFPELFYRYGDTAVSMGNGNTDNYSAGDDGVYIKEFYRGIDLVFVVKAGWIESFFVLNHCVTAGDLMLRQFLVEGQDYEVFPEVSNAYSHQEAYISTMDGERFTIEKAYAYDANKYSDATMLNTSVVDEGIEIEIPQNWLSASSTRYPVLIDPTIWSQNSLPIITITGTKYSAACWTNSCDYFMAVGTPPNTTVTDIMHSFGYESTGSCVSADGGYSIEFGACTSPSGAPGVYTNPSPFPGNLFADTISLPEFIPCYPAPSCASQPLNFTLHFFRCNNDTTTSCASNCIRANRPWEMFIKGETVTVSAITATQTICQGDTATIIATPQYGVPPYSYAWSAGTSTTDTLIVSPAASTNYTVTVTDACANTASLSTAVNIATNTNPGFTFNPSPACENEIITFQGNGVGAAADYDWILSGSSAPGGVVNDNQNPTVSYSIAGTYDAILAYSNGTCVFNDTQQVFINPAAAADVTLNASPAGAVCAGDTVTFTANPVNGGPAPNYEFFIDGVSVQNGASDILTSSAFINGSVVQVVMTSNGACVNPNVDTASVFMAISASQTPQVTISPDTAVCDGSPITMTATFTNGGPAPFIQWYANGIAIPGANTANYSFNVFSPDTIISVEVTSSLTCVTNPIGTDTSIVSILTNVVPGLNLFTTPAGTVCNGDTVEYYAAASDAGVPSFVWYVNGVQTTVTDSIFVYVPNDNDSISVSMTSGLSCSSIGQLDTYIIADVSSGASPVVNVSANPSLSICQGDTVSFNATLLNGGSSPTFSWTINGMPAGTNDSVLTVSSLNNNDVVQVIATSSLTCASINSDTAAVTVSVANNTPPAVSVVANPLGVCEGDSVQLIAQVTNGGATPALQWFVNGVANGMTTDTIYLTSFSQGDSVSVSMTSSLSCAAGANASSAPYFSVQLPYVTPDIDLVANPPDSLCLGQQMIITATTTNGGTSPQINWFINGIPDTTSSNYIASTTFGSGDVIIAQLISNEQCLTQTADTSNIIRIYYYSPLSVQLTTDSVLCPGYPIQVIAQPQGGQSSTYSLIWSNGVTDSLSVTVAPEMGQQISVRIEDNCTAQPAYDTLVIPTMIGPVANFTYINPQPGSFNHYIQFNNLSTNVDTWQWLFLDSNVTSTELNPVHQFAASGTYEVVLYTMNNNGCVDSIHYFVIVEEDIAIYYPNTFTPNGDGINEFFAPVGASFDAYELTIWNRWGEVVYTGDEAHPWNGRKNNDLKPAPEAVYVWRIDFGDERFGKRVVTGRVTLIR